MPRRDISPGITISAAIVSTVCGVFQTVNLPGFEIVGVSREITVRHQAGDTGVEAYDLDIQYRQKLLLGNYTPLIQLVNLDHICSYLHLRLVTPWRVSLETFITSRSPATALVTDMHIVSIPKTRIRNIPVPIGSSEAELHATHRNASVCRIYRICKCLGHAESFGFTSRISLYTLEIPFCVFLETVHDSCETDIFG